MYRTRIVTLAVAVCLVASSVALAQKDGAVHADLISFNEVPAVSTFARGAFDATVDGQEVDWELGYINMQGSVTQAHLHFAQPGVNGAIMVFLCSNLGNGPVGTPACPEKAGELHGTIDADRIGAGAAAQGVAAGQIVEFLRALRAGIVYVNVHSTLYPGGEIRGQLSFTPE
jgi:hypothetical protein